MNDKEIQLSKNSRNLILIICLGLFAGFLIKMFAFDILHVSGTSMESAIHDGQTVFVNKLKYGIVKPYSPTLLVQWAEPEAGDVVIYLYNNKIVVKRCVAVAGELLEFSNDSVYNLHIGDKNIPLTESQYNRFKDIKQVPQGYILAIGDNYRESVDSRTYGFVSVKNILGKVSCR